MNISDLFIFIINGIDKCFKLMDNIILENNLNISLLDVFVFLIFMNIVLYIIRFVKQINEIDNTNKKEKS